MRLGGPFQRTTGGGTPRFAFDISLATRDGQFTVGIISTGRQGWVKLGQRAFTLPPAQLKQLAGTGTWLKGGLPGDLGVLGVDPRGWITNVKDEGVETIEGTKVIHLSADVDIPGLVKDLDKLLSSAGGTGLNAIAGLPTGIGKNEGAVAKAVKSAGVDIWTGEKDLPAAPDHDQADRRHAGAEERDRRPGPRRRRPERGTADRAAGQSPVRCPS